MSFETESKYSPKSVSLKQDKLNPIQNNSLYNKLNILFFPKDFLIPILFNPQLDIILSTELDILYSFTNLLSTTEYIE